MNCAAACAAAFERTIATINTIDNMLRLWYLGTNGFIAEVKPEYTLPRGIQRNDSSRDSERYLADEDLLL
jgi:hypothetical protein